jgi:hypothetical protein
MGSDPVSVMDWKSSIDLEDSQVQTRESGGTGGVVIASDCEWL